MDPGSEPRTAPGRPHAGSRGPGIARDEPEFTCERQQVARGAIPRVLFLDDDPKRAANFLASSPDAYWVQTAEECIARLEEQWDEVNLDHDLGGGIFVDSSRKDCGMEVVRWLCDADHGAHLKDAYFIVHTHNKNAAGQMLRELQRAGYHVFYRPFGMDLLRWLEETEAPGEDPSPDITRSRRRWKECCFEWLRRVGSRLTGRATIASGKDLGSEETSDEGRPAGYPEDPALR